MRRTSSGYFTVTDHQGTKQEEEAKSLKSSAANVSNPSFIITFLLASFVCLAFWYGIYKIVRWLVE
jgi:hypothetical protein